MIFIDIIASFVIALLSGMGIGSGGLFVIYITLISDSGQLAAQGANLLFFLFSSAAALLYNIKKRNIYWSAVLFLSVIGILGALLGSLVAGIIPTAILRKTFGILLTVSGALTLFKKEKRGTADIKNG